MAKRVLKMSPPPHYVAHLEKLAFDQVMSDRSELVALRSLWRNRWKAFLAFFMFGAMVGIFVLAFFVGLPK